MKTIPLPLLVEALACLTMVRIAESDGVRLSPKDYVRVLNAQIDLRIAVDNVLADQILEVV